MSARLFGVLATAILLASGRVSAEPEFTTFDVNFSQQGTTNSLSVSMVFRAFSTMRYLALGGGFTVRCNQSTTGQINAKNLGQRIGAGTSVQVLVPATPTAYGVPGYSSMPTATCANCTITWVARAIDAFFEQTPSLSGEGAFFTMSPWTENILVQTNETSGSTYDQVCRGGQPQCCTPGCSIP
jgi:hypothetical protein